MDKDLFPKKIINEELTDIVKDALCNARRAQEYLRQQSVEVEELDRKIEQAQKKLYEVCEDITHAESSLRQLKNAFKKPWYNINSQSKERLSQAIDNEQQVYQQLDTDEQRARSTVTSLEEKRNALSQKVQSAKETINWDGFAIGTGEGKELENLKTALENLWRADKPPIIPKELILAFPVRNNDFQFFTVQDNVVSMCARPRTVSRMDDYLYFLLGLKAVYVFDEKGRFLVALKKTCVQLLNGIPFALPMEEMVKRFGVELDNKIEVTTEIVKRWVHQTSTGKKDGRFKNNRLIEEVVEHKTVYKYNCYFKIAEITFDLQMSSYLYNRELEKAVIAYKKAKKPFYRIDSLVQLLRRVSKNKEYLKEEGF